MILIYKKISGLGGFSVIFIRFWNFMSLIGGVRGVSEIMPSLNPRGSRKGSQKEGPAERNKDVSCCGVMGMCTLCGRPGPKRECASRWPQRASLGWRVQDVVFSPAPC